MQLGPFNALSLCVCVCVFTESAVFGNKMRLSPGGVKKTRSTGVDMGQWGYSLIKRKETAALQKQDPQGQGQSLQFSAAPPVPQMPEDQGPPGRKLGAGEGSNFSLPCDFVFMPKYNAGDPPRKLSSVIKSPKGSRRKSFF